MEGIVIKSTGSWYEVRDQNHKVVSCRLRGKFKLHGMKVTNPIAVGDQVEFEMEAEEKGIIIGIRDRHNYIIRKSTRKKHHAHIIAANIDQAVLLATLVFPRTSLGFIDRFLVSAESFRIPSVIVFNKADLLDDEMHSYQQELAQMYESLGYPCLLISALEEEGIEKFRNLLNGKTTLLSGHSGVGKSTLINKIISEIDLKTSEVSTYANKGVHTTTFAEMFEVTEKVSEKTFIIDTPGIKELGLMDIGDEEVSHYFPELRELLGHCRYNNCTHTHEPGCAILQAIEEGKIYPSRYENYLGMLGEEDNRR
ncbi:ribosome small subunit-dependent GTPase A [Xanthovirga aplysinae]|uniref:ribosome small subunit-dependent GTPase A n=1 Tax=Xanthovirga aplysinae TaxID=2529853 RepID=UPI0012BBB2DB|nr:ribosome small subunit-dependent GTPase A [Xanthovirga aplysinae]MTI30097.1 ribosome small subunit-dependent GTPase A [Xanthovirga aplysinae]